MLSEQQVGLVRDVKKADQLWRSAKQDAASRAKTLVAREVSHYLERRDDEVRNAFNAGVPKAQIGREGLGSTASKTVEDSLNRTAGVAALLARFPSAEATATEALVKA